MIYREAGVAIKQVSSCKIMMIMIIIRSLESYWLPVWYNITLSMISITLPNLAIPYFPLSQALGRVSNNSSENNTSLLDDLGRKEPEVIVTVRTSPMAHPWKILTHIGQGGNVNNQTIKAGGSTKRAQNVGWSGWVDGWIPLRLLWLLKHLWC